MSPAITAAPQYVLTATAPADRGLLFRVHEWVFGASATVVESKMVTRDETALLRVAFTSDRTITALRVQFAATGEAFAMRWRLRRYGSRRLLLAVSKPTYAVTELLSQWADDQLDAAVIAVVSNHLSAQRISNAFGIPFRHIPVGTDAQAKRDAEHRLLQLVKELNVDTVILARYMQVLSNELVTAMAADDIDVLNFHHGDPAAFPGADPHGQALARGVTHIGGCAHYVTPLGADGDIPGLDQGRIITQNWWPIPQGATKRDLARVGRRGAADLADAVVLHSQDRLLPSGAGTEIL